MVGLLGQAEPPFCWEAFLFYRDDSNTRKTAGGKVFLTYMSLWYTGQKHE